MGNVVRIIMKARYIILIIVISLIAVEEVFATLNGKIMIK